MTNEETVNLQEPSGEWDGGIWYSSNHRSTPSYATVAYGVDHVSGVIRTGAFVSAFGDLDDDDEAACVVTATLDHPSQWRSQGHNLTAIKDIDRRHDGEYMEALICDECHTVGDMYIVDGRAYPDIAHRTGAGSPEAEDEAEAEAMEREMDDLLPFDLFPDQACNRTMMSVMQVH